MNTKPDYSITKVEKYKYAGVEYDTLDEARQAAAELAHRRVQLLNQFPEHLPSSNLLTLGIWVIKNEGTNVDSMNSGPPRVLAYVKGSLSQAVDYALTLDGFWGYGPGYIEEVRYVDLQGE